MTAIKFGKLVGHLIKQDVNSIGRIGFGQIGSVLQGLDQFDLAHAFGAPDYPALGDDRVLIFL
jgi:hypothetical protein